uniref:Aldedh domain-containing protein n=1 Tax=Globodera pallida TaxID=36090 RepID=A0A183C954_GLOPA
MVSASADSASKIVEDQRNFFKTGATRPVEFRKEQLKKMREMIVQNKVKICEAIYKDLRRNTVTNMIMEVDGPLQAIDFCLSELDDWVKPQKLDNHELGQPLLYFEPKGVVFLLNIPGNTVVIKPSEVSPNTSKVLKEMFDATFDKKFIAVVEGAAPETQALLEQRFDHIFYTGSSSIAKLIMQAAAKFLTPVTLELGGKCPVVVEDDADVEKAAQRIAEGKWLNSGQTCLAPDYVMTTDQMKPKLVAALQKSIKTMYGENPKKSEQYSRMVNKRHFDRVKAMLDKTNGQVLYKSGEADREDVYIPPVVVDTDLKDALMQDEVFGPVLPIITVKGLDEAIDVINDGEKPLGAYLFTNDQQKVDKFLNSTSSGGVTINDILKHVFVRELPFGGVGNSGMGSYHGKHGFVQLSHAKAVLKRAVPHSQQQRKVNVGEMVINPDKLDIVLHSAALFALLKAKANSLLRLPNFPNTEAVLYSRCALDAVALPQLAKCVVPLLRARDQMEELSGIKRGDQAATEEGKMQIESAGGSEMDWMGWPHRLGKWLLDRIAAGDGLRGKANGVKDDWKDVLDLRKRQKKTHSENIIRKFKWQKRRSDRQKVREHAKKNSFARNGEELEAKSVEGLKRIIWMRRTEAGKEWRGRTRRGAEASGRLMKNVAKLRRIQKFFKLVEHCNQYMDGMGEANSDFLSQLPSPTAGNVRSVHFRTHLSPLDALADELQRILHNYTFHSLPILSPRILPLLPEAKSEDDGPNLLSPTMFSFHNEGIFSLPSLFGLISTSEADLVELLDLFLELAGASRALDKIEAQIEPRRSVVERQLYPTVLKLEKMERKWEKVRGTFSNVQKRHLDESGYTFLENTQFRKLLGRTAKGVQLIGEYIFDAQIDLSILDESLLEQNIFRIARIEDNEEAGKRVAKRELPGDQSAKPPDLLFRVRSKSLSQDSELSKMHPFLFTNKLRQGPVVVNGAVLAPRAFFATLSSPNFMTINLLSPMAFTASVLSPRAMATSILSPTAFTANVLNPNALWSEVLSPKFFHTNVLSPRALAALVLSPRTMLAEVLSPKLIEARVLNPGTFYIGVLGPNILQPRVLSPSNFGITVLNPNILSPSILSKGNFTVQILSPSIMSDDVTPEQLFRGQWQKETNGSRPSGG